MNRFKTALQIVAYFIVKSIVSLRYRVTVRGMDKIYSLIKSDQGILFLPNHTAEIDPVIVMSILGPRFHPRPLVIEHFYYSPGLKWIMNLIGATPVPNDIASGNKWKLKQVEKLFHRVEQLLSNGENFLIYPSGRLKVTGKEEIGGGTLIHHLLQHCPNAKVVLIRTTGLWGSRFSRALTGNVPSFSKKMSEAFKTLLKNGIFFAPRRDVVVEIEIASVNFPLNGARLEIVKFLEDWYNRYPNPGPEPLKLVSELFWKEQLPQVSIASRQTASELTPAPINIPQEVENKVYAELSKLAGRPAEEITSTMHLSYDLGLDSLDIAELYVFLDEYFDVSSVPHGAIQTVGDLLRASAGQLESFPKTEANPEGLPGLPEEIRRSHPMPPLGQTIPESFFLSCERMGSSIACVDALTGPLTYHQLKTRVLILANIIKELPGERIGVLLPASIMAQIVALAIMVAGKTPVMLNWTIGVRALDHGVDLLQLQHTLSSYRFLSRLENGEFGKLEEHLILLEEFREKISLIGKLKGLGLSLFSAKWLLKHFIPRPLSSSEPAVILFTSGTESLPKAVPLTHQNILSNQRGALQSIHFSASDSLMGVLPPFHSFGFSVTGLLPILAGLRICYSPDPTDSQTIARCIERWQPTIFCSAPSFIRALFKVASPLQLESLRLTVAGAEKTPEELFTKFASFGEGKQLIEGYGITECGPIVTFQRPDQPRKGVGKPVVNVLVNIIDLTTGTLLPQGSEGEICISGPGVFPGYIGIKRDPFITIDGQRWYRSGDRGFIDADGNLILTGRLKRFVKIGGEMVSLGGLEEEIDQIAKEQSWPGYSLETPSIAVTVVEKDSEKPSIILFTTCAVSKEEVNASLRSEGWGKIAKISEVRTIEQIPLTGTGKTHYRLLDELLG